MSKWTMLPIEVLGIIFNDHIESSSQLAKCRLVCQSWNQTAEVAMLGKHLDFDWINETKFCNYITKKPLMAKHIKNVSPANDDILYAADPETTETRIKLWSTICTENLRSITSVNEKIAPKAVFDVIRKSPIKYGSLRKLGSAFPHEPAFEELAYLLRGTLQDLSLRSHQDLMEELDEFKKLKRLDLYVYEDGSLENWENMLKKCHSLTTLCIEFELDWDGDQQPLEQLTREEVQRWIRGHHVQQHNPLKTLEYDGECTASICEYFLYKFPNLERAVFSIQDRWDIKDERLTRMIAAIKAVEDYRIEYNIIPLQNLDFEVDMGKPKDGNYNKMTIEWSRIVTSALVKVNTQRSSTSINITLPSNANNQSLSLMDIKQSEDYSALKVDFRAQYRVSSVANSMEMMAQTMAMMQDPNFLNSAKPQSKQDYQNKEDVVRKLTQAMSVFQHLKAMEIWAFQLTVDMIKQLPVHRELKSLEIVNAVIESNAFTAFNVCFPALDYLALSSCVFQKSLATLTLIDDRNRGKYEKLNQQGKLYSPTLFHLELTTQSSALYLMLLPSHTTPLKIYKEQFEMWSKELYSIISISCGFVDTVIVRLGHISHALDVKKYM
ncbi:hypothetical protein MBANPS3_003360 [Mucor bainieri]